jgi:hypothetical protein
MPENAAVAEKSPRMPRNIRSEPQDFLSKANFRGANERRGFSVPHMRNGS